jgi:DNA processing protein
MNSFPLPTLLREIPDPPHTLYIRGTFPSESLRFLSVVGSRAYTAYGKHVCESLLRGLSGYPIVIISGLALGMDGIAHRTALEVGLKTVAVPGSGLDDSVLYPATHRTLAHDILDAGGALLSEFEAHTKARPENFPRRNRIMAGLSHAVLVVEAEERSGTLITSRLATEYNRDVLAVPGPIQSPTSKGPHMLLKRGAGFVSEPEDILRALAIEPNEKDATSHPNLSKDEEAILALLTTPIPRDEVIRASEKTPTETNIVLSSLELKGIIEEKLGKMYRL